jgi:hypothetical protein
MPQHQIPHSFPSPTVWINICALLLVFSGCARNPIVIGNSFAGASETNGKIPITTTSADAKALYLQALSITEGWSTPAR